MSQSKTTDNGTKQSKSKSEEIARSIIQPMVNNAANSKGGGTHSKPPLPHKPPAVINAAVDGENTKSGHSKEHKQSHRSKSHHERQQQHSKNGNNNNNEKSSSSKSSDSKKKNKGEHDGFGKSSTNRHIVYHPDHPEKIYDFSSTSTAHSQSSNDDSAELPAADTPQADPEEERRKNESSMSLVSIPRKSGHQHLQPPLSPNPENNVNPSSNDKNAPKTMSNGSSKTSHKNASNDKNTNGENTASSSTAMDGVAASSSSKKQTGSSSSSSSSLQANGNGVDSKRERRRKLEDPACFPKRFEVQVQARVRSSMDLSSQHLTDLPEGSVVTVEEIVERRARISRPLCGWLSVTSKFGARIILPTNSKYSKIGGKVMFKRPIQGQQLVNGQYPTQAKVVDYNEENNFYKIRYDDNSSQWIDIEEPSIQFISQHKAVKVQKPIDPTAPTFTLQTSQAFFNQFFCKDYPQYQAQSSSTTRHMDISPVAVLPHGVNGAFPPHGYHAGHVPPGAHPGGQYLPPPGHPGHPPPHGTNNHAYPGHPHGHGHGPPLPNHPHAPYDPHFPGPHGHGHYDPAAGPQPNGPPPHGSPNQPMRGFPAAAGGQRGPYPPPNGHGHPPQPPPPGHPYHGRPGGPPPPQQAGREGDPAVSLNSPNAATAGAGTEGTDTAKTLQASDEFVNKVKEIERRIIQHLHQRGYDESHPDYHRYLQKAKELAIQKAGKEREKMLAAQNRDRQLLSQKGVSRQEYEQYLRYRQEKQRQHAMAEQQRKQQQPSTSRPAATAAATQPTTAGPSTTSSKLTAPSKSSGGVKGLIVLRGLPGSGKTTLAKKLAQRSKNARICTEDRYHWSGKEDGVGEYKFQPQLVFLAREWCTKEIRECIEANVSLIILDNHNARISMYEDHIQYAVEHGYRFRIIEFVATASLIDKYRARSYKKFPREVYVKLLKLWEHDPRTELINPTFGDVAKPLSNAKHGENDSNKHNDKSNNIAKKLDHKDQSQTAHIDGQTAGNDAERVAAQSNQDINASSKQ